MCPIFSTARTLLYPAREIVLLICSVFISQSHDILINDVHQLHTGLDTMTDQADHGNNNIPVVKLSVIPGMCYASTLFFSAELHFEKCNSLISLVVKINRNQSVNCILGRFDSSTCKKRI